MVELEKNKNKNNQIFFEIYDLKNTQNEILDLSKKKKNIEKKLKTFRQILGNNKNEVKEL
jgi:hypothetical protein